MGDFRKKKIIVQISNEKTSCKEIPIWKGSCSLFVHHVDITTDNFLIIESVLLLLLFFCLFTCFP